jgi:AraC-like DNA-binding protein
MAGAHVKHDRVAFQPRNAHFPGLTEVTGIGYNSWTPNHPHELAGHAHADHWEIHYLVHGQIVEEVVDRTHLMNAGDVLIASPGMVHTGINRVRRRCGLVWLGVRLPARGALPGMSPVDTAAIRRGFAARGGTPFAGDPALPSAFAGLLAESERLDELRIVRCRAYLQVILGLLCRAADAAPPAGAQRSAAIAAATAILERDLERPLRMADVPRQVGLSRSAFSERFTAEIGLTPLAYRTLQRLEAAKPLLLTATSVAVAARLGFASPQHLLRHFRRAFGMTPAAWRRRQRAAGPLH